MKIREKIKNFLKKNKNIIEKIELTFFYMISILLLISINKIVLDKHLSNLTRNKLVKKLLRFKLLKLFSYPERALYWNLFSHELFIRRDVFMTTHLIKFNVLLFNMISAVNNLILAHLNFFFVREAEELSSSTIDYTINQNLTEYISIVIFTITFISYTYFYIQSLRGLKPKYPNFYRPVINAADFACGKKRFREREEEIYNN